MPYYRQQGWGSGDCPAAEAYYQHGLSLPLYPSLTEEEQAQVIQCVFDFYKTNPAP
jgi:dTDP-4-amino-4,6-dideoxygalactose transaminase